MGRAVVVRALRFISSVAVVAAVLVRCSPYGDEGSSTTSANDSGVGAPDDATSAADTTSSSTNDVGTDSNDGTKASMSCADLRARDAATGVYAIAPVGLDAGVEVYCDMTTVDGGWTLIARSVASATNGTFGWKQSRGDVRDDSAPYSLDVRTIGPFSELLFGKSLAKTLVPPVFYKTVPPTFLSSYTAGSVQTDTVVAIGTCDPPNTTGPLMLRYVGHTDLTDHFFFRDNPPNEVFGLTASGWNTNGPGECSVTGNLSNVQAMIFVR